MQGRENKDQAKRSQHTTGLRFQESPRGWTKVDFETLKYGGNIVLRQHPFG